MEFKFFFPFFYFGVLGGKGGNSGRVVLGDGVSLNGGYVIVDRRAGHATGPAKVCSYISE